MTLLSPLTSPETYEDDINNIPDSPDATIDTDPTVYTKIFRTADFDASGRVPVPSLGAKYAYYLLSCRVEITRETIGTP